MHPTFAVCNNGAHVIRLRLRLSLSRVTSVRRVCATLPLRPPVRHVSFRLAYYDYDETVWYFIVVALLTAAAAAAHRWFVGFDFSNFYCLFVFYFYVYIILYIFTHRGVCTTRRKRLSRERVCHRPGTTTTAVLILCFWSAARENWSVVLSQTRCDVGVGGRREENVFYNTYLRTTILQWPPTERVIRSLEYNNIYFFFQRNSVINILTCRTCFAQRRQRTNNLTINCGFSLKSKRKKLKHIIIIINYIIMCVHSIHIIKYAL